jgi:hypothetical protein
MKRILPILLTAAVLSGCEGERPFLGFSPVGRADKEGDWTILLLTLRDPAHHVEHADKHVQLLGEHLGWKGLFAINKAGHSELYWGRYLTPLHAQKNLKAAKAHTTQAGTKPFAQAIVVPLPGGGGGPAEWDLRNARGTYTFLVAIFQDVPEKNYIGRKKFAVDYCRRLRKGNYEAYFHHGPPASWVTIGAFDAQAARVSQGPKGKRVEILDPRIKAIQKDFPYLAVNGTGVNELAWDPKGRKTIRIPQETRLIPIPRDD